jgi:ATP-dependent DNA helicase
MLRRLKADIEVFIPPKKELLVYTPLTTKQRDLYKSIVDKSIRQLVEVDQVCLTLKKSSPRI